MLSESTNFDETIKEHKQLASEVHELKNNKNASEKDIQEKEYKLKKLLGGILHNSSVTTQQFVRYLSEVYIDNELSIDERILGRVIENFKDLTEEQDIKRALQIFIKTERTSTSMYHYNVPTAKLAKIYKKNGLVHEAFRLNCQMLLFLNDNSYRLQGIGIPYSIRDNQQGENQRRKVAEVYVERSTILKDIQSCLLDDKFILSDALIKDEQVILKCLQLNYSDIHITKLDQKELSKKDLDRLQAHFEYKLFAKKDKKCPINIMLRLYPEKIIKWLFNNDQYFLQLNQQYTLEEKQAIFKLINDEMCVKKSDIGQMVMINLYLHKWASDSKGIQILVSALQQMDKNELKKWPELVKKVYSDYLVSQTHNYLGFYNSVSHDPKILVFFLQIFVELQNSNQLKTDSEDKYIKMHCSLIPKCSAGSPLPIYFLCLASTFLPSNPTIIAQMQQYLKIYTQMTKDQQKIVKDTILAVKPYVTDKGIIKLLSDNGLFGSELKEIVQPKPFG